MDATRRVFLKGTGAAGIATAAATLGGAPAAAASGDAPHPFEMPRGMTLLNMRRDNAYRLGVKTDKGILDVGQAAQALNMPAPVDMDDLLQNGRGGLLKAVVDASARAPQSAFVKEDSVE